MAIGQNDYPDVLADSEVVVGQKYAAAIRLFRRANGIKASSSESYCMYCGMVLPDYPYSHRTGHLHNCISLLSSALPVSVLVVCDFTDGIWPRRDLDAACGTALVCPICCRPGIQRKPGWYATSPETYVLLPRRIVHGMIKHGQIWIEYDRCLPKPDDDLLAKLLTS